MGKLQDYFKTFRSSTITLSPAGHNINHNSITIIFEKFW